MPKKSAARESTAPSVKLSPRGVARLRAGHPWVYRSDVAVGGDVPPGAVVRVIDPRGHFLGTALYSSSSQIAIRLISREAVADLPALVAERIRAALAYRQKFVTDSDAFRVVFSEADFLPGLIVDKYNDVLSVQILTQAMDAEPVRGAILETLVAELQPDGILERVDPRIRELEQLPPRQSGLLWGQKSSTVISMNTAQTPNSPPQYPDHAASYQGTPSGVPPGPENESAFRRRSPDAKTGVRFHYEGLEGQKTGAFLDQRENYAAAARYAHGEALDVFCYQGGFALHLAPRCSSVTGVDSSRPALEMADRNAALNGELLNGKEIEWIEGNAFDLLKDYAAAGRQYHTIVLDPPAFAKSKRDLEKALRGYKELNLRALKMLRPDGVLVTCSCSFHVSAPDFLEVVADAARDAHKSLLLVETRGQAKDHPVLLNVPETSYLKCLILIVSD